MVPEWFPAPLPHPRLGKTKLPRCKTNKRKVFGDFHAVYLENCKMVLKWYQNGPPPPSRSPARLNKNCHKEKIKRNRKLWV